MISEITKIMEAIGAGVVKIFQKEIRREFEYNAQLIQDSIFRGAQNGVEYAKRELSYTVTVLFTLLLGTLFVMYGASVFLDRALFEGDGLGFILVGVFSIIISLIIVISKKR